MIDPSSYTPAYVQLAAEIRQSIERGELAPGQQVPSESTLVQQYRVARETARRAVASLRHEGVVVTRPGRGTYVRGVNETTVVVVDQSARVSSRMPTRDERQQLTIPEGVPVLVVHRNGHPDQLLPADRTVLEVEGG